MKYYTSLNIVIFYLFCLNANMVHAQHEIFADEISSPIINSFAEDSLGYIWIGTNHGLNKYNGSNFITYFAKEGEKSLNNDNVTNLFFDKDGILWMTNECGVSSFDGKNFAHKNNSGFFPMFDIEDVDEHSVIVSDRYGLSKISKKNFDTQKSISNPALSLTHHIAVARELKEVWAISDFPTDEIYITNTDFSTLRIEKLPHKFSVEDVLFDNHGRFWISGSDGTLLCYNAKTHKSIKIPEALIEFKAAGKQLFMFCGKDGTIILGIQNKGIISYNPNKDKEPHSIFPEEKLKKDKYIAFLDSHNNIWLSDRQQILKFYASKKSFSTLTSMQDYMKDRNIKNICIDKFGHLWIRSSYDLLSCNKNSGDLIWKHEGSSYGHIYIDSNNRLWAIEDKKNICCYSILNDGKLTLLHNFTFNANAFSVGEDKNGIIWIALGDSFVRIGKDFKQSFQYAPEGISFSTLMTQPLKKNLFLFTQNSGIYEYTEDGQFTPVPSAVENPNCILCDNDDNYWVGSYNSGLSTFNPKTKKMKSYKSPADGLVTTSLKSLIQDKDGNIWMSTASQIARFNNEEFTYINDSHFGKGNLYNLYCSTIDEDGNLYFAGMGGVTVVRPYLVGTNTDDTFKLNLDEVLVNGQYYQLDNRRNIKLSYQQNMLSLWYSGIDYENGPQLLYKYKLEGYDNKWINVYNTKRAFYSKLPAGHYKFMVSASRPGGHWSTPQELIDITISPAPWATWWAKCLYLIAIIGIIYFIIKQFIQFRIKNEKLELAQHREELRQEQINFLTNISHEYRTPLTLIYAPLMQLLHSNHLNKEDASLLNLIKRSTDSMKNLTEQILNLKSFDEIGEQTEQLKVAPVNLPALLTQITDNFRFLAHENRVKVEFRTPNENDILAWIDSDKLKKIMSNLLSNAIKYTQTDNLEEEKLVTVSLTVSENKRATIKVEDNGPGIPKDKEKELFKRFSRFNETKKVVGSGIGLNYTAHLAHLHKGSITYEKAAPHGSIFIVDIPIEQSSYSEEELQQNVSVNNIYSDINAPEKKEPEATTKKYTILVVEDNTDVRHYIVQLLSKDYQIISAHDGQEALELIQLQTPDLVVSDIVMPRMDGFDLCSKLKKSNQWGHLPVILLTAKSDVGNNIKGLNCGADNYVSKPFDPSYLLAVISNLLSNRKRIQQLILNLTSKSLPEESSAAISTLTESDRILIENIHKQMDKHIHEENFSAKNLAENVNLSYSRLYSRIKDLTGQSPQNYIIAYRMNRAMELLKVHDKPITEIGYEVGFSSVQYFSRSFKKYFGISPSEV